MQYTLIVDKWKKQFGSSSEIEGSEQAFAANVKGKGKWAKKKGQGSGEDATKSLKTITVTMWKGGPYEEALQKEVG
jgi:hypothetical protein